MESLKARTFYFIIECKFVNVIVHAASQKIGLSNLQKETNEHAA